MDLKNFISNSIQINDKILQDIQMNIKNKKEYINNGVDNLYNITDLLSLHKFKLLSESEDGYIEYKLMLNTKNDIGLIKTFKQIIRRMETSKHITGTEEIHYVIGVKDKGFLGNLTYDEVLQSYEVLKKIVSHKELNGTIKSTHVYLIEESYIFYMIINKKNDIKFNEIKIAFVGETESGKTSTISNLIYGTIKKKQLIFKHENEKISGRTMSVKKEIIGINNNTLVNYKTSGIKSILDIALNSDIILNIFDYPGLKLPIIIKGILNNDNDYIFVIISAKNIKNEIKNINMYNILTKLLKITILIIVTHIDTYECEKINICDLPTIYISNNNYSDILPLVKYIENNIKYIKKDIIKNSKHSYFTILDVINIPDNGVIFSGMMNIGDFKINDSVFLTDGKKYTETKIMSIHKKYIDSNKLYEGETGSIKLENVLNFNNKYYIISNKSFVSYNNIVLTINKLDYSDIYLNINDNIVLYISNKKTDACIHNIKETDKKYDITIYINHSVIIPKLEIIGYDIGVIFTNTKNIYCGNINILITE